MAQTITSVRIEKEQISKLRFPESEVLKEAAEIGRRRLDLERATSLGNLEHGKCCIVFEDDEGIHEVETTIWATTETQIVLKGGVTIPINRIHRVI